MAASTIRGYWPIPSRYEGHDRSTPGEGGGTTNCQTSERASMQKERDQKRRDGSR